MTRVLATTLLAIVLGLASQSTPGAQAPITLHVITSNGIKTVLERVIAEYEKSANVKLDLEWGASLVLKRTMESGKAFDATIVTPVVIDDLIRQGIITAASRADIASSSLAAGVRKGGVKGDVSTRDGLKARMAAAKTVTYSREGAATGTFNDMIAKLGMADAMKAKIVLQPPGTIPADTVVAGQNELVFAPLSELVAVPNLEVIGNFPREFQVPLVMTGGVSAKATHAEAARAFIAYMTGPKVAAHLKASGMEQVAAAHH